MNCKQLLRVALLIASQLGVAHADTLQLDTPQLFGQNPDLMIGDSEEGMVIGAATDLAVGIDGRVYVLDGGFGKVLIFAEDGAYLGAFGGSGEGPGDFTIPMSICTDPTSGDVWVGNLHGRLCHFTADGEVVGDVRLSWTGSRAIRSVRVGEDGLIYASCANVLDQTMIQVLTKSGELQRSFGDTFGVARPGTDTEDEMRYATGFLDLQDDTIYYTQKNPYEIRLYGLDGRLKQVIRESGQGVPSPPPVLQPDGSRIHRSLKGSWGIVALTSGAFLNNIVVPVDGETPAHSITEYYDPNGVLRRTEAHETILVARGVDDQGRVWAIDNAPHARVLRYPSLEE